MKTPTINLLEFACAYREFTYSANFMFMDCNRKAQGQQNRKIILQRVASDIE